MANDGIGASLDHPLPRFHLNRARRITILSENEDEQPIPRKDDEVSGDYDRRMGI